MKTTYREAKREFEREFVERALRRSRGNVAAAAREAEVERKHFYELADRAGITPADFRKES